MRVARLAVCRTHDCVVASLVCVAPLSFHWTVNDEASLTTKEALASVNIQGQWVPVTTVVDLNAPGRFVITVTASDTRGHFGKVRDCCCAQCLGADAHMAHVCVFCQTNVAVHVVGFTTTPQLPTTCAIGSACDATVRVSGMPPGSLLEVSSYITRNGVSLGGLPVFTVSGLVTSTTQTAATVTIPWVVSARMAVGSGYGMVLAAAVLLPASAGGAADGSDIAFIDTAGGSTSVVVGHTWNISSWSGCSASCGAGQDTRSVVCQDTATYAPLDDMVCVASGQAKPQAARSCMVTTCVPAEWRVGEWSSCAATTCGTASTATRTVECVNALLSVINDDHCVTAGLPKPATSRVCAAVACSGYQYAVSPWRPCTQPCGSSGVQYRSWLCKTASDATVSPAMCRDADVAVTPAMAASTPLVQACNRFTCPGVYVTAGEWGACSKSCGGGTATRTTTCWVDGVEADMSACITASVPIPSTSRTCNVAACTAAVPTPSLWSLCSDSCDGTRSRSFTCTSDSLTPLSWSICAAAGAVTTAVQSEPCGGACDFCANNTCSDRGACTNGACKCNRGFDGPNCEFRSDCGSLLMDKYVHVACSCCLHAVSSCFLVPFFQHVPVCSGMRTAVQAL